MADFRKNFKDRRSFKGRPGSAPRESRFVELRIEKMVQGGEGMAHLEDGRVCFVAGALPGELCNVLLTVNKKDFTRGRVVDVIEANPDRVKPKCPLYGRCGGCSLQHLDSAKQAEYLAQVERENFKRLAHVDLPDSFRVHTGSPWNYRNRARLAFCGLREGGASFGFREQESNHAIAIGNCPILTKGLNEFLKGPAKNLKAREINVFDNGAGEVSYYYDGMTKADFQKHAVSVVEICGRKIEADASVFFQSNLGLLPELVDSVCKAVDEGIQSGEASDAWLIDLFSGVGFFAALLQDKFKRVTTVERDEGCLKHAEVNLSKTSGAAVENVSAPAEDWLAENVVDIPATLIVDPPRTGLPKTALDAIVKSSVKKMIYVSCDPVTLARDFAKLAEFGFEMRSAEAFAFYPQTPHMEMLAILSR